MPGKDTCAFERVKARERGVRTRKRAGEIFLKLAGQPGEHFNRNRARLQEKSESTRAARLDEKYGRSHFFFGTLFVEDFREGFEDFNDLEDFIDFDDLGDFDDFDFIVCEACEEDDRDVVLLLPEGFQEDTSKFFCERSCAE